MLEKVHSHMGKDCRPQNMKMEIWKKEYLYFPKEVLKNNCLDKYSFSN